MVWECQGVDRCDVGLCFTPGGAELSCSVG